MRLYFHICLEEMNLVEELARGDREGRCSLQTCSYEEKPAMLEGSLISAMHRIVVLSPTKNYLTNSIHRTEIDTPRSRLV